MTPAILLVSKNRRNKREQSSRKVSDRLIHLVLLSYLLILA
ncbi:hypothetical protein [Fischerella thermalis]|nr:hypothetical protein [Fischerella thermalis]